MAFSTLSQAHPDRAGQAAKPVLEYGLMEGLSQGEAHDLTQDSIGFLWIATKRGLNRFDGAKFEHLTIKHGLRYNYLSALFATQDDQIWAGDIHGGLSLIEGMRVTATVNPPENENAAVSAIIEVSNHLYVATSGNGIFQVRSNGKDFSLFGVASQPQVVDQMVSGGPGTLLALAGNRLFSIDVERPQEPLMVGSDISAIWSDDNQTLVARNDGEVGRWEHGRVNWLTSPFDLEPTAIAADDDGNIWAATRDQVFQVDSGEPAIEVAGVRRLVVDREKVLWLASDTGLYRSLGNRIEHFWLDVGDESPEVYAITSDPVGATYFGTHGGILRRDPNGHVEVLNDSLDQPVRLLSDMLMNREGNGIWAADRSAGLFLIDIERRAAQLIAETEGLVIRDLEMESSGAVWMATSSNGLFRYDATSKTLRHVPADDEVYTLTLQDNRWMWYGVNNVGLFRLDLKQPDIAPELIKTVAELERNQFLQVALQDGGIWMSMAEGGLIYLKDDKLDNFSGGPIVDETPYVAQPLPDGTILVGTETGVYQLNPKSLDYAHYGKMSGFRGIEANIHATHFSPDGFLWIGTMAGASRFRLDLPLLVSPDPAAKVMRVEAGEDLLPVADGGTVPAHLRKVTITFGAVSTRHPEQMEYRYWLVGADESWSVPDTTSSVSYSGLPGGNYQFKVQASKPAGRWGEVSDWQFSVLTPVWQKSWFLALMVAALMAATVAMMRYRNRRVSRANLRLRKEVAERTQSIEDARARLEDSNRQLEYQASYDELTGLFNRRSFQERLRQAWTEPTSPDSCCYLMYLDLDQFKIVNDTCGHAAGDQLLRQLSTLIRGKIRTDDTVGRLGGDEFGILLTHCPTAAAIRVAEQIRMEVENFQFVWDSEVFRVGVSIGVVPVETTRGDINELQQLADAACYAAKEAGRNQVHLVSDDSDQAQKHRGEMRWVKRLHDAMEHNLFALYEQKIVPLKQSDEPERVEILLRMREPESRKLIPPGAFLPAAERYGLGVKMDEWVVTNLLRSLFVHSGFNAQGRRYWVNLSGLSMGDAKFCDTLLSLMANSQFPPGMINFEITETAVIRNIAEASRLIDALSEMGCEFALDDFGSGLSSFGYLKKLKVDYLKIDGMFIRDIAHDKTDRIFVKSIIDIAHTLNIRTIAEFVEDDEILAIVKSLGADYAQGFGVHRPQLLAPNFPPLPQNAPNLTQQPKRATQ